jgi:hypothetical protein
MIRASTDQMEQRLQQIERNVEFSREEELLSQARKTHEEFAKIHVEKKLERVQERLVKSWLEIRKVTPQLLESGVAGEPAHQIELFQGACS